VGSLFSGDDLRSMRMCLETRKRNGYVRNFRKLGQLSLDFQRRICIITYIKVCVIFSENYRKFMVHGFDKL
jgi:hypothetical protein